MNVPRCFWYECLSLEIEDVLIMHEWLSHGHRSTSVGGKSTHNCTVEM